MSNTHTSRPGMTTQFTETELLQLADILEHAHTLIQLQRDTAAKHGAIADVRWWARQLTLTDDLIKRTLGIKHTLDTQAPTDPYEVMLRTRETQIKRLRHWLLGHLQLWGDEAELRAVDVLGVLDGRLDVGTTEEVAR